MDEKFFMEAMTAVGIKTVIVDENLDMGVTNPEFVENPTEEVPSPFLAGTNIQYAWDATSLELLKRCPQLYKYKMIDGWQSADEDIHLRWGQEYHKALEEYELLKADQLGHDECVFHVIKELLLRTENWKPEHKFKNKPFLVRSVIRYLDKFRDDTAKTLTLPSGKPAVEVSFMFELNYGPTEQTKYVLCGHLDRVVDYNSEVFFMDRKTSSYSLNMNWYHPHNQMSLYTIACKVVFNTVIKGGIIDHMTIQVNDSKPERGFTHRTNDEMDEWLSELEDWLDLAKHYAEQNYWPKNDTACDKYGGCRFREICSKSPGVRERFLRSEFKQVEIWNPLKPR